MVHARRATVADVDDICRVCADGWRATYPGIHDDQRIEQVIADFYTPARVSGEIEPTGSGWDGWWVAVDASGEVIAAGGGGMTGPSRGEVFVLYADPQRRGEGAGTAVLEAITDSQRRMGANEQWVAVARGNDKGIPFYLARGFIEAGTRPAHGIDDPDAPDNLVFRRDI